MKKKILFVYEHKFPKMWMDGLSMALDVLEKDFNITRLNLGMEEETEELEFDFILGWGAFGSPADSYIQAMADSGDETPKGLCLAGNVAPAPPFSCYKVIFHETDWVKDHYLGMIDPKIELVKAFGINNELFGPLETPAPLVWDYIGVGAMADWKRWPKMINKSGNRLVIGEYQTGNEQESLKIVRDLVMGGVTVSNMVTPFDLANYYHWSRICYMPADVYGGGERVVLEARSCGLEVEIESDNKKLAELLNCPIPSYLDYAKSLRDGIKLFI